MGGILQYAENSETLGLSLGLYQFYGLRLGLKVETHILSALNSVLILRLRRVQSPSQVLKLRLR